MISKVKLKRLFAEVKTLRETDTAALVSEVENLKKQLATANGKITQLQSDLKLLTTTTIPK
jgi:hypothetical protein